MPEVTSKTSTIVGTATVTAQTPSNLITINEIDAAVKAIAHYSEAGKEARKAEQERDQKLMVVFEKTLGVKTLAEVKALDPEAMAELLAERIESGAFKVEKGVDFDLKHDGERKNPAWKELYIAAKGQAEADKVAQETKPSHTWHIIKKVVVVQ